MNNNKKKMALGFVFGAAVLVAFGVLYRDWWSGELFGNASLSIGVRSVEACFEGQCEIQSLSAIAGSEYSGWAMTGQILFWVALATSLVLIAAGGLVLADKEPSLPMAPTTLGFLLSSTVVVLAFVFVMTKPPGLHGTGLQAGISLFPVAVGGILGILGSVMLAKLKVDAERAAWEV